MTVAENIAQVLGYPKRFFIHVNATGRTRKQPKSQIFVGESDPESRSILRKRSLLAIARASSQNSA
jgi:hypothetical protein